MKRFRYFSLITVLGLSGCFSLDQSPQESMAAKDAYARVNDAQYWVNGMYVKLRNYVYGNYVQCTEAQADLLNATESYSRTYAPLHRWETLKADNGDLSTFWLDSYNTLSNINEALGGFPTIETRDDDEKTRLAELTGELHLGRAYVYTRLVTAFGKVYDPATARTDLGVPLELVYNIKTTNKRATLDDTYAQILDDITKAERLLATKTGEAGSTSFTVDAAKALKARVLLYMGKWAEAYEAATGIIDNYPLATSADELREIWYDDAKAESITQLFASTPEQLPSTYSIYISTYEGKTRPFYIPTRWTLDKYDDADHRKAIYFKSETIYDNKNDEYPGIYIVHKYPGNPKLASGGTPNYAHSPKVFRVAEMYLIASEAAFKKNDQANALTYLNRLREARGLDPVTSGGDQLWQEIKDERLRELAFEGFRLMDLKRWKEPVIRRTPQNVNALTTDSPASQFHQLNRSADDFRFVWPIPSREVYQGKLKQNEGWED